VKESLVVLGVALDALSVPRVGVVHVVRGQYNLFRHFIHMDSEDTSLFMVDPNGNLF
jgi:hypothetical protein